MTTIEAVEHVQQTGQVCYCIDIDEDKKPKWHEVGPWFHVKVIMMFDDLEGEVYPWMFWEEGFAKSDEGFSDNDDPLEEGQYNIEEEPQWKVSTAQPSSIESRLDGWVGNLVSVLEGIELESIN